MNEPIRIQVPESLRAETLRAFSEEVTVALEAGEAPLLLVGGTETFCRGLDLLALDGAEDRAALADQFVDLLLAIRRSGTVVIASVEGAALGGGVGLAAACDLVIASRAASFGLPEALFELAPLTIWPILRERMTSQAIRRLALGCAGIPAEQAAAAGLVDEVAEAADLEAAIDRWLRAVRRARSPGVAALKRFSAEEAGLEASMRRGARVLEDLLDGTDALALARAWENGVAPWETA